MLAIIVMSGAEPAAAATPSVSIRNVQLVRTEATGDLVISGTVSAARFQTGAGYPVCARHSDVTCQARVEGRRASDGSVVAVGTIRGFSSAGSATVSKGFAFTARLPRLNAVRAVVIGRNGQARSGWSPIADPVRSPTLELSSVEVGRDRVSGDLVVTGVATATDFQVADSGVCARVPDYQCKIVLEAKPADGGDVRLLTSFVANNESYPLKRAIDISVTVREISHVRARLVGGLGELVTEWEEVDDPLLPAIGLTITSLFRNPATRKLAYEVSLTGSDYLEPGTVCGWPNPGCRGFIEVKRADGRIVALVNSNSFNGRDYPYSSTFTAAAAGANLAITAIRGAFRSDGRELATPWIPLSPQGVRAGHDVGAAQSLALAATAGMTAAQGCLNLFPVAPPVPGSSLNQAQAACFTATNGGTSLSAFLAARLATMSTSEITALLAAAGVAASAATAAISPDLDYGHTLPAGCTWAGPVSISCFAGGTTTTHRPISAPPVLDPVYENNFLSKANTGGAPDNPNKQPLPYVWLAPAGAEVWREALRQCVETLHEMVSVGQTLGDLVDADDCARENIFFTGQNVEQATQHDIDALAAHPEWTRLTYISEAEKKALGIERLRVSSNPSCSGQNSDQQCDEYPYFATVEGYGGPAALRQPSFRPIKGTHNGLQGLRYGNFTRYCPSLKNPESPDRSFLVIADLTIPLTFGYCGR